jgi:hypothetical protein
MEDFMKACFYCTSTNLVSDIKVAAISPVNTKGAIQHFTGPLYNTGEKQWLTGDGLTTAEPMLAEVCQQCGTTRLYVKNLQRDWCTED